MLRAVKPVSTVHDIVQQISTLILSGDIKPGDKIPGELEMMELFKVGRSSIREAKKILISRGLMESYPGKGSYVKQALGEEIINTDALQLFMMNQLSHLNELRVMLETQVLTLAIQRATKEDLAKITETFRRMEYKIKTNGDWEKDGLQFHIDIVEATYNPIIINIYSVIASMIIDFQKSVYVSIVDLEKEIEVHKGILECLEKRELNGVERVMKNHFEYLKQIYGSR